jgi:hypothetical protein
VHIHSPADGKHYPWEAFAARETSGGSGVPRYQSGADSSDATSQSLEPWLNLVSEGDRRDQNEHGNGRDDQSVFDDVLAQCPAVEHDPLLKQRPPHEPTVSWRCASPLNPTQPGDEFLVTRSARRSAKWSTRVDSLFHQTATVPRSRRRRPSQSPIRTRLTPGHAQFAKRPSQIPACPGQTLQVRVGYRPCAKLADKPPTWRAAAAR